MLPFIVVFIVAAIISYAVYIGAYFFIPQFLRRVYIIKHRVPKSDAKKIKEGEHYVKLEIGLTVIVFLLILGFFISAAFSSAFYEYSGWPKSKLMVWKNGELVDVTWGTWSRDYVNVPLYSVKHQAYEALITQNPKLRKISIAVSIIIKDPKKFYFGDRLHIKESEDVFDDYDVNTAVDKMKKILEYWMYEFRNAHSRQLAEFYNPQDETQQENFKVLVKDYFEQQLATYGLGVTQVENFNLMEF